ncbi:hypothetical protein JKF63_07219 [Porcisia hertigi]|uniref:Pseudouridine synthase RsuA/RluA-like domain-containing protein n=1 Tax=Porcisia hertigi TaxID=2761500 RepID=A0A837A987_9TRYP|nr:hypothetical protein JKF63_07219 [Porcisia hertigi]
MVKESVSAAAAPRAGGSAATLADMVAKEDVDSRTTRHHIGINPSMISTANPPLPAGAAMSSTERRMLEHYATLLHNIRAAAARVATSDYRALYATEVKEALTAAAAASTSSSDSGALWVPRSVVWQDAAAASTHPEESREDATMQAERRLAAWASLWYRELEGWHSRHSKRTPDANDTFDAQQSLHHDELWDDRLDSRERVVGSREEDQSLAAQLLEGDWRAALESLLGSEENQCLHAPTTSRKPHSSPSTSPQRLSVEELFSSASVRRRHRVFWRPQPHRGSANTSSTTAPPLPRRLALAPVAPTELHLLQHPPSPGLRVLSLQTTAEGQRAESQETSAGAGVIAEPSLLLTAAAATEVAAGRATGIPPSCVVRLRRRLWLLQHLPRHLPASLVRFQESRRPSRRAGGGSCREVPSSSMPHVYLLRSHALEKLPWYTLCVLGEVLEKSKSGDSSIATVLHNARTHICTALFFSVPTDYAALHDYVHTLFLSLGSSMVAHAVATRQRQLEYSATGSDRNAIVTVMEDTFAQTAIALLQPPSPEAYAAAGLSSRPTWASSDYAASLLARSSSALMPSADTDVIDVHVVTPDMFCHLCDAVQSWRNYHLSLYCETLSQIADSNGAALRELARILRAHPLASETQKDEKEGQEEGVVVLAPESAAAIATAILLQRLDQLSRPSALFPSTGAGASPPPSPQLPQTLYFTAPHDKEHAVASYFKGIFHSSFFKRVVTTTTAAAANTNPTAVLEGAGGGQEEATQVTAVAAPGANRVEWPLRDWWVGDTCTATAPKVSARTAGGGNGSTSATPALALPPAEWEHNAAARLVGRTLRRLDRYPTRTTEAFFARSVRGDDVGSKRKSEPYNTASGATAAQSASVAGAPPLSMNFFVVNLQAAVDHWHNHRNRPILGVPPTAPNRPQEEKRPPLPADAIVLLASPPMLPHGLHAVYKPAGVTCTLHAHYPSLAYPFLTCELPWGSNRAAAAADRSDGHRAADPLSSPPSPSPPCCVPVLRQQGLVNRIDVGTSGVVLVARTAAMLHRATDAMTREHNIRKTYRALVQRWPPFSSSCGASTTPLFSASPFLSPMASAIVCAPVYAAGATAASIRCRPAALLRHGSEPQSCSQRSENVHSASRVPSTLLRPSSVSFSPSSSLTHVYQHYATLHAALQDQRHAITRYRVLEYFASVGVAYVQVELRSGRRHQIRQHFAQLGFPLVGDARYHAGVVAGHAGTTFGMQRAALHAYTVDILASADDGNQVSDKRVPERVVVQASLPADMSRALLALRQAEQTKSRRPEQPQ